MNSFCIHGHFYQPPREDPISGQVPDEVGAAPYRNWNERINAECYHPNAELGNFERISFNVGPSLCEWMHTYDTPTCKLIAAQDRANWHRYGVGNAMAQPYHHTILPLASARDKRTQIYWGTASFEHHFGRRPRGMWLPETAADTETLAALAEQGIEYTILAPWQANTEHLDPTEPYRVALPGGRSIIVFFYHAELSTKISFDPASTSNADLFIRNEIQPRFNAEKTASDEPQLLLIASDGELYGHHQHFRDQFLARLMNGVSASQGFAGVFPALWLRQHSTRRSISIHEKTSWSCHHGVMRWMGECDCTPGYGAWKAYLRRAFDRLAEALDQVYVSTLQPLEIDPWELRDRYIYVLLGEMAVEDLITEAVGQKPDEDTCTRLRLLLAAQHQRQRMYASCAWFHEDFNRIEPRNAVAYAAQVVRLVQQATGVELAGQVKTDLAHVISSRSGLRGDLVFRKQLQRASQQKIGDLK